MTKYYEDEEQFHARDRKQFRKQRRLAQESDRSKFKKSDVDQEEKKVLLDTLPRGRVLSAAGEGIRVAWEGQTLLCSLKGDLKKEWGQEKTLVAAGDWVRFEPKDKSIVQIEDRISILSRTDIRGTKEQIIATNIDQVLIVVSLTNPPLKPALVDRYLIAAEKGNIHPLIAINKIDLLLETSEEEQTLYRDFLSAYEPLGIPILSLSSRANDGIESLRSLLHNKTTVIAGQSGVGKSSLLNAAFHLQLKTGELATKTQKGSHTTTLAELLPLPNGGYCVDTPGIRSFAIWNLQPSEIFSHFRDIALFAKKCRFPDCNHINEPSCAVLKALKKKKLSPLRYDSFQSLLSDAVGGPDQRTRKKMEDS